MILTAPESDAARTFPPLLLSVPAPYRAERDARLLASCWPTSPDDPREDLAWAVGSLQPGDGVAFVGSPGGPAVWTRVINDPRTQPRKNAVAVCAGARRSVAQDHALLTAAEASVG